MRAFLHVLLARLRGSVRGDDLDRDFDEELATHLAMAEEEKIRQGLPPDAARRAARLELGGLTQLRDAGRRARGLPWVGACWLDLKLGVRLLAKYPGLTIVSTLALSIAIAIVAGVHAATAFIVHPVLPVPDGDRVVAIWNHDTRASNRGAQTLGDMLAWRGALASVEDVGAFVTRERVVTATGGPTRLVLAAEISPSAFRMLRVPPLLGRSFDAGDEPLGGPEIALIGFDLWQSAFLGDPDVVGKTIRIGGMEHAVVGVMPDGFRFPVQEQLWTPLRVPGGGPEPGEGPAVQFTIGRLEPGVTIGQAEAELRVAGSTLAADHPRTHASLRPRISPYARSFLDAAEPGLATMYQIARLLVGIVLLVAAINVGTLVYARNAARVGEVAVRAALGASRRRIAVQMFIEALVLSSLAAAVGLAIMAWPLGQFDDVFRVAAAEGGRVPYWLGVRIGPATAVVIVGLVLLSAVLTGILPALKLTDRGMPSRLPRAQQGVSGLRFGRSATVVVVSQVALSVALLTVGGAQARSFVEGWWSATDDGLAREEYLETELRWDLGGAATVADGRAEEDVARRADVRHTLARQLALEPGVAGVTFDRYVGVRHVQPAGTPSGVRDVHWSYVSAIEPDYFSVIGAPLQAGREFAATDVRESGSRVAIVNEAFVRSVLPAGQPIGQRILPVDPRTGQPAGDPLEIIGVARDFPSLDITQQGPGWRAYPSLYLPLGHAVAEARMTLHVPSGPSPFVTRMTAIAAALDPALVLYRPRPLEEADRTSLIFASLYGFGAVFLIGATLLLSAAGIYAMMSFTVSQRTREMGIRMALGANPARVIGDVFSRAARQLGAGVAIGLAIGSIASDGPFTLSEGLLAHGPGVLLGIVASVIGLGLAGCARPLRRALRIEPTEALRGDG